MAWKNGSAGRLAETNGSIGPGCTPSKFCRTRPASVSCDWGNRIGGGQCEDPHAGRRCCVDAGPGLPVATSSAETTTAKFRSIAVPCRAWSTCSRRPPVAMDHRYRASARFTNSTMPGKRAGLWMVVYSRKCAAFQSITYRPQQVSIMGVVACGEEHRRTGAFIHTQVHAVVVILRERQAVAGSNEDAAPRRRRCCR